MSVKQMPRNFSRPLDVHRWSDYPELNGCLTLLVQEIDTRAARQRARKADSAKSLRNAVRSLVLDLYVAWMTDPELELGVPLSNRAFNSNSRYRALFLKYEGFVTAYRGLRDLGYLDELRIGFNDRRAGGRSFVTRARATPKLISLLTNTAELSLPRLSKRAGEGAAELIIKRDENKKQMEYDDTPETISKRADLVRINLLLDRTWIDVYLTDAEMSDLRLQMQSRATDDVHKPAGLDFTRRSLVRIFNNGSWDEGGRFYGGWWQSIPRDSRRSITLNGKHTVEVDFSGMHVALLYAETGAELIGDAYDIGVPRLQRERVKEAFNILLNRKRRDPAPQGFAEEENGISWTELTAKIYERHPLINQYFGSGYGVRLQNADAEIANAVLLRMERQGYACLPVHDSFIVHHAMQAELTTIMLEEFARSTFRPVATKDKLSYMASYEPENRTGLDIAHTIRQVLSEVDPYQGYRGREADWYRYR